MTLKNSGSLIGTLLATIITASVCGCGGGSPPPPISVSAFSSAQTLDESGSAKITATVVNDPASKGVTWSLRGLSGGEIACSGAACGTLSNQTATSATYTAPSSLSSGHALGVQVVAASVDDPTKSAFASLQVVPPPSITTTSLPAGTGGAAYNATLQESGGVAPFSWSVASSSLPSGLTLGSDGTIAGTPCTGGTSDFNVQVADSGNPPLTASAPLSISVTVLPLSVVTTSLPDGVTDTIYSQGVQVAGGIAPYTWSVTSGSLPSWASLNSTTGKITGIPGTTGTANFTLQVADSECSPLTTAQALSISVVSQIAANDSELSGHYAFLFNGFDDATGTQVAVAGSFTADGKGNITAGIEDENGPNGAALNVPITGTYNIGFDNRGAFTITTTSGSKTYAVVLNSISSGLAHKARFVEFDDTTGTSGQRGSGLLRLQDTSAFSLSSITGPYAFGFAGQDAAGNREAIVGSFSTDGSGMIPSGVADQNVAGTATNPSLTGTYTAPTGNDGRTSITLNPSGASSLHLAAYVVSAGELLAMRTDTFSSDSLASGTILAQASTSFDDTALSSPAVYYLLGVVPSSPTSESYTEIGLMTPDGKGGLMLNTDINSGSSVIQNKSSTGSYSVVNTGRVTVAASTSAASILYLVDKNQAFLLGGGAGVGLGFVEPQAAAPTGGFGNSSFSGTFSAGTIAPSVTANINASGLATLDGAGNFSESATLSNTSGLFVNDKTTGTYSVGANGRGTVTNFTITVAGIGGSLVSLLLFLSLLLGRLVSRRNPSRRSLALFCATVLIAPMLAGCPLPSTNQFVFYIISPTKAVMMHEASSDTTPGITVLEQ
jgi:putative Ig domain-containing protein